MDTSVERYIIKKIIKNIIEDDLIHYQKKINSVKKRFKLVENSHDLKPHIYYILCKH